MYIGGTINLANSSGGLKGPRGITVRGPTRITQKRSGAKLARQLPSRSEVRPSFPRIFRREQRRGKWRQRTTSN